MWPGMRQSKRGVSMKFVLIKQGFKQTYSVSHMQFDPGTFILSVASTNCGTKSNLCFGALFSCHTSKGRVSRLGPEVLH